MSEEIKINSNARIIEIMMRMIDGDKISEDEIIEKYQISSRTVKRDMSLIKNNYADSEDFQYHHDTLAKNYFLERKGLIPVAEIFAIIKVLIGTRAFSKSELRDIADDLLMTVGTNEEPIINKALTTIRSGYHPISKSDHLIQDIMKFNNFILDQKTIRFSYLSSDVKGVAPKVHKGVPLSLYFSNHYFYVVIYVVKEGEVAGDTYVYRIDRFKDIMSTDHSIQVPRDKWEDEDTIRSKTYLLNSGSKISYQFLYRGYPQAALDQLPGSKLKRASDGSIYHAKDGGVVLEGELSFNGAVMWVLGQGDLVTVLAPNSLIKKVMEQLQGTLNRYLQKKQ